METTNTLSANSNAHGTERLISLLGNESPDGSQVVEVVYTLGDAGGYVGVTEHIAIEQDPEGDFCFSPDDIYPTLAEAVEAAKRSLA